jgi:predicted dehydrogenase
MSDLRAGIIGFGLAGEVFHAPLIAAVDGLELAAIVTRDPARQTRARAAYPFAEVTPEIARLWDLDLVVVATPNRAHVPLALEAIEHGVAVVVDKPLAPSAADGQRVVDAAAAAGVPLTVFQNRRWDGDFLTLQRLVAGDALGRVVRLESRFARFRPELKGGWRELPGAEEAGGQLFDLGAHLVDQARELFGPPTRVYAEVDTRREGAEIDDDAFVALEHPGGERSHLWMSAVAPVPAPRFVLSGLAGGFAVDGLDPQEPQLADGMRPGDERYGVRDERGRLITADGTSEDVEIERGRYEEFYIGVRDALRGDGPLPVDPADSVEGLRILEAARRSAAESRIVDLRDA